MEYVAVLILAALVFGLCYLIDRGFTKLFRNQAQHHSGLSVRLNRRYGSFGIIIAVLGIASLFTGLNGSPVLLWAGVFLILVGAAMVVYYMTFGIFYDSDSFLLTTFGKRSTAYRYRDIRNQQLYNASGNIVIELHMTDGRAVQLQSAMEGVYPFLDTAFAGWLKQTGKTPEDCSFHDPQNSCWFPPVED